MKIGRAGGSWASRWQGSVAVLLLAAALWVRLDSLDAFLTIDELQWRERSQRFALALAQGNWSETYQSEHPGVITMWSGALGLRLAQLAERHAPAGGPLAEALGRLIHPRAPGVPAPTFWARRVVALLTWLGLVLLHVLLRRLLGPAPALLAMALVALDPFLLAFSRLHHLDGLLATFTALSVVSLLLFRKRRQGWSYLVLSAAMGGLAMASKSPGFFLAPWVVATLLYWALRGPRRGRGRALLGALGAAAVWGLVAAAIVVAVWPATWRDPLQVLRLVEQGALRQGLNPHENLNYFLGRVVADPGPLFYPVAWA
ncbi:MAG: glycosyltransferase family 39 protein, partial [Chloroflexota bacterium]